MCRCPPSLRPCSPSPALSPRSSPHVRRTHTVHAAASRLIADLFASVLHLEVLPNIIVYVLFTAVASQLLAYAYAHLADSKVHEFDCVLVRECRVTSLSQHPEEAHGCSALRGLQEGGRLQR